MKWLIAFAFFGVLASLGSAGFFLLRGTGSGDNPEADDNARAHKMFWSLALRVALSVSLFLCILLAWKMGYIHPSGLVVDS